MLTHSMTVATAVAAAQTERCGPDVCVTIVLLCPWKAKVQADLPMLLLG